MGECISQHFAAAASTFKIGIFDRPITNSKSVSNLNDSLHSLGPAMNVKQNAFPLNETIENKEKKKTRLVFFGVRVFIFSPSDIFVVYCSLLHHRQSHVYARVHHQLFMHLSLFSVGISNPLTCLYAFMKHHKAYTVYTVTAMHCKLQMINNMTFCSQCEHSYAVVNKTIVKCANICSHS